MWLYKETRDQLSCMYRQETEVYQCSIDYMKSYAIVGNHNKDFDKWRRNVCKWSYDIVDHFGFDREVVYISLNYLDRYIANCILRIQRRNRINQHHSSQPQISAREFQLAGITGLYIALKIHGNIEEEFEEDSDPYNDGSHSSSKAFRLSTSDFSRLSRGVYSENEIIDMEQKILNSLNWYMNPPTPVDFLVHFLHSIDADTSDCVEKKSGGDFRATSKKIKFILYELARYFLELAVSVYDLSVRQRPSCVALASIVMALDALDDSYLPRTTRSKYFDGLSDVIDHEHAAELEYVKVLIQDVCNEALSCSSKLSSHIARVLCNINDKHDEKTKRVSSPRSSPRCVSRHT